MSTSYVPTRLSGRTLRFRDWSCLRHHLVLAYDDAVPESAKNGRFENDHEACWLLRRGSVRLFSGGRSVTAKAGEWVFVGRALRRQVFSDDARVLSLHFQLAWPEGGPVLRQEECRVLRAADHPELERAARPIVKRLEQVLLKAGLFVPEERCSLTRYLEVQRLLPAWLAAYLGVQEKLGNHPCRPGATDERVLRAVEELDRHPLDTGFPEEGLRRAAGLGKSQLNELFARALGRTPRRYLDERRLEEARSLLRHTGRSVKQVAFALGFRHESHFSLWFKRQEGRAPSVWRAGGPAASGTHA